MKEVEIEKYILEHFKHVIPLDSWGERSFFINPERRLKRGSYFCTLKSKDGENDCASKLDRKGVFRWNIGVSKKLYKDLFREIPKRPEKGGIVEGAFDFAEIDKVLPHPVYGWMGWISVLNPSEETFNRCIPMLQDAYQKALVLTEKKLQKER